MVGRCYYYEIVTVSRQHRTNAILLNKVESFVVSYSHGIIYRNNMNLCHGKC